MLEIFTTNCSKIIEGHSLEEVIPLMKVLLFEHVPLMNNVLDKKFRELQNATDGNLEQTSNFDEMLEETDQHVRNSGELAVHCRNRMNSLFFFDGVELFDKVYNGFIFMLSDELVGAASDATPAVALPSEPASASDAASAVDEASG